MCGIVAAVDLSGQQRLPRATHFDDMIDSLAHRGPDGRGAWHGPHARLGHRRLAIIERGPAGAQPMVHENGAVITFNGEIYNHDELRARLQGLGHVFRSRSDTEVVLRGYVQWGVQVVPWLRGMFAFVIVDDDKVIAVRDGFGIKPLFVYQRDERLLMASEIKTLWMNEDVDRTLHVDALHGFLGAGCITGGRTGFAHIHALPPGHVLTAKVGVPGARIERVVDVWPNEAAPTSDEQAVARLDAALRGSVGAHLVSDVDVGVWLSGGVDSAALAHVAAGKRGALHSFSVGFAEAAFDERARAAHTANLVGTNHHEQVFGDVVGAVQRCARFNDDLLADPALLPTEQLAQHTSARCRVVLSGDGADEVLAGYPLYAAARMHRALHPVAKALRTPLSGLLAHAPGNTGRLTARAMGKRLLEGFARPSSQALGGFRMFASSAQMAAWWSGPSEVRDWSLDVEEPRSLRDWLQQDLRENLVDALLVKVDRASMQHGVEVRVPYLDPDVLHAAASLSPAQLMSWRGQTKVSLRMWLARTHPSIAFHKKTGFSVPIGAALRADLGVMLDDLLSSSAIKDMGLLHTHKIRQQLRAHRAHDSDDAYALYAVLVLCLWWTSFARSPSARC
jgi:asparagine synthase (glutamine-hydrolysing)